MSSDFPDADARIGAYLDGEMTPAQRVAFEADLAADAVLAAEVQRLRGNDSALRSAFGDAAPGAIDHAQLTRLGLGDAEVVSLDAVRRDRAAADKRTRSSPRRWPWPAAGALAAGVAGVLVFGSVANRAPAGLESVPAFQVAMRDLPSTTTVALEDGAILSPRLTFAAGDGRYCREFSLGTERATQVGIACRAGTTWRIEALVPGTAAGDPGAVRTAGGDDNSGLDAVYRRLGAADPVGRDTENQLIASGWEKSAGQGAPPE